MSFETLKPELWDHVLYFLTPSLPKPLSGWTKSEAVGEIASVVDRLPEDGAPGTVGRKDIRAQGLTVLMRTSIAFNHHASRALYGGRVISDNLSKLIDMEDTPSPHRLIGLIPSKAQNLRSMKSLHLEYRFKGHPSSYLEIMNQSRLAWMGVTDPVMAALDDCVREAGEISHALVKLQIILARGPFPRLESISVCSIFGPQNFLWQVLGPPPKSFDSSKWSSVQNGINATRCQMANTLLMTSISHCCHRGNAGPLSLPPIFVCYDPTLKRPSSSFPLFTIHFDLSTKPLPVDMGRRTRWIFEEHIHRQDSRNVMLQTSEAILDAKLARDEGHKYFLRELAAAHPEAKVDKRLKLEIYASGDRLPFVPPKDGDTEDIGSLGTLNKISLGPDLERMQHAQALEGLLPKLYGDTRATKGEKDIIQWLASPDSPQCEACTWRFGRGQPEGHVINGEQGKS